MNKWDDRFLALASSVKGWSKDPSTQIGAVIAKDNRVLSTGYNGFPAGISDDDRLNTREVKYGLVVHAEMNAIFNAAKNGVALRGSTIYVDGLHVCKECAKAISSVGINRVVATGKDTVRWSDSLNEAAEVLKEAGVEYETK